MLAAFVIKLKSKQITIVNTLYISAIIVTKISLIYPINQIKLIAYHSKDYWYWVRLREIVLRLPLYRRFVLDDLIQDQNEIIFGLYCSDKIIGGAQLKVETDKAKMRQVAIHPSFQNKGFGKILLDALEVWCKEHQIGCIYCHARETASAFYLRNGYSIEGSSFMEVGIPHFYMKKVL